MTRRWAYLGAALLWAGSGAAITAAPVPAAGKLATFKIGTVALAMPVPDGFCPPAGEQAARMELMAQTDSANVTALALASCAGGAGGTAGGAAGSFILIKATKTLVDTPVERAEMLQALAGAFKTSEFRQGMAEGAAAAQKAVEAKSGQKIEMVGEVSPRGTDEACAYIGGSPDVKGPAGTIRVSIGGCLTVVGHRFLTLVVARPDKDGTAVPALMARARQLAETIRPVT
jgi:hypothetical protein